jgi:riboflavin synthase
MFTGIVLKTAELLALERLSPPVLSIRLELEEILKTGDSMAVNGVCLTVIGMQNGMYRFHLSAETLKLANFPDLSRGSALNIELPVKSGDFFGGHLVSGHIDGTVRIRAIQKNPAANRFGFTFRNPDWRNFLVSKGSVALNGISLTVSEVASSWFSVEIIPHTLESTNFRFLAIGDRVNVELDLIGKYLYNFRR